MSNMSAEKPVFILGLDGATFDIIKPMAEKLPAMSKVFEKGAWGVLRSTVPATTPPAWTSISSGVNPGKHGLFDFWHITSNHELVLNNSLDKKAPEIWDYLLEEYVIVAHLPFSYPPKIINGIMTTGMLTPDAKSHHTLPDSEREIINKLFPDYDFEINWREYRGRRRALFNKVEQLLEQREGLLKYLISKNWRLMMFIITETDRAQHVFWGTEVVEEVYRRIDGIIEYLLELADRGALNLFIVSDHGFRSVTKRFGVNVFFEKMGYLKYKDETRGRVHALKDRLFEHTKKLLDSRHTDRVINNIPEEMVARVFRSVNKGFKDKLLLGDIDWPETKAFMFGSGCVYINKESAFREHGVAERDVDQLKDELSELLLGITDPSDGSPVIERVVRGEDAYNGPFADLGPDLVIEFAEGYSPSQQRTSVLFQEDGLMNADHHPDGIFLSYGEDIAEGAFLGELSLYDTVPTVLHALGSGIPAELDGEVIRDVFRSDSILKTRDSRVLDTLTPTDVKAQIRRLKLQRRI